LKSKNEHKNYYTSCPKCKGQGKKSRGINKKAKQNYLNALEQFKKSDENKTPPTKPKGSFYTCNNCSGLGIISSMFYPEANSLQYPKLAIIGGGIGGVALAVACLHRGIPFTLYEKDVDFNSRSQGYGLTLQQASKTIKALGILNLEQGVVSTRHLVHQTNGTIIGEWGVRKWLASEFKKNTKRNNIHIARQSLRLKLLEQLEPNMIQWNHKLINVTNHEEGVNLNFEVGEDRKTIPADLVVGADGIYSAIRKQLIGEHKTPLRYLNCMVILGICPLSSLKNTNKDLLDNATVFQTANGEERIYIMPYAKDIVMWQLSFPILEKEAIILSKKGAKNLKEEALQRTQWHNPIPEIVKSTSKKLISGYPVYDRTLLKPQDLEKNKNITLIGDAAHPMSPFKGQGANQALLDALDLAKTIEKGCYPKSEWKTKGLRKSVLNTFEQAMLKRSAIKVKDSAKAANFLHSDDVLKKVNAPRGRFID